MLDARDRLDRGQAARRGERGDSARRSTRHRDTIRSLRDLSFNIEPVVLRDQGFGAGGAGASPSRSGSRTGSRSSSTSRRPTRLGENAQVALYQIVRDVAEPGDPARAASRISISVAETDDGTVEAVIADDGAGERRRASFDAIERACADAERPRSTSRRARTAAPRSASCCPPTRRTVRLPPVDENGQRPASHLLFVWTTNGYELRERDGEVPGVGDDGRGGRGAPAGRRRSPPRRSRATAAAAPTCSRSAERGLGGGQAEHERRGEAARVAARRDPARVGARRRSRPSIGRLARPGRARARRCGDRRSCA